MTRVFVSAYCLCLCLPLFAQDQRTQYPALLANTYLNINLGYIDHSYSNLQLKSGYEAESIDNFPFGMRITLGHEFNKHLSGQISYSKTFHQSVYENLNVDHSDRTVWAHFGEFTLRLQEPLTQSLWIYGEGGIGFITQRGFEINQVEIVNSASYGTLLIGGGLRYNLNDNWDLFAGTTYSPENNHHQQPDALSFLGGFSYTLRPLSREVVEKNSSSDSIFPENLFLFGYTTNTFGYEANNFFSKGIFFGGRAQVAQGFWIRYQRNVFHTAKYFSLDAGVSFGHWESERNRNEFFTFSAFPVFRFTFLHSKLFDSYFHYSIAGPSFISRTNIDNQDTGKHFTFQDFMGIGFFAGKSRKLNLEINLNHYSNGNIFPNNDAVKIPFTFCVGYTF
jgi:hypothetical protein